MLDRILNGVLCRQPGNGRRDPLAASPGDSGIVVSVPPDHQEAFTCRIPGLRLTYDVLSSLFREAKKEVLVFSPFIDASFTNLAMMTEAPIRVLTTVRDRKTRSLGVVERISRSRNVQVRYIHQKKNDAHLYQLHAKMILVDRGSGYVGSANLTDAGLHYNFELGFRIASPAHVAQLVKIFDYLFDQVGFPAKM